MWKRGAFGGRQALIAGADTAQAIGDSAFELDACGNAPISAGAFYSTRSGVAMDEGPMAPDMTNARLAATIGGGATQIAAQVNPVAGAVVGAATVAATALFSIFSSSPPDPAVRFLIAEMPHNWTGRSNIPPGAVIYALDRCGYLHEVGGEGDLQAGGWISREVIAVNWKVFQMMPIGDPIESAREIERARMPRPADAGVLRSMLGNDIRLYVGREERLRGPWDADAHIPPTAGSPAMWAEFAGSYVPTRTASPGEF
jgi:hypothetical protein